MTKIIYEYKAMTESEQHDFLMELESFERFYNKATNGGVRHRRSAQIWDLIETLLLFTRPFAYATKDNSWGEFEKHFTIIFRNYLKHKKRIKQLETDLLKADKALEFYDGMVSTEWYPNPNWVGTFNVIDDEDIQYKCHRDCEKFIKHGRHHHEKCYEIGGKTAHQCRKEIQDTVRSIDE